LERINTWLTLIGISTSGMALIFIATTHSSNDQWNDDDLIDASKGTLWPSVISVFIVVYALQHH
jgi:hypothetical protein